MFEKYKDFLSSFGIMLLGVLLLFFSSVYFGSEKSFSFARFPHSDKRAVEGGDVQVKTLPVSKPSVPLMDKTVADNGLISGRLTAAAAVVLDAKTKTVLFNKNAADVRPLASITKLMTAMVLIDSSLNWNTVATVTAEDIEGDHHIEAGEQFTLEDLWNIALIGSSNSAINTLVRSAGFSREDFAVKMNQKAQALRLLSARFVEPTGLSENNMASAADTAKMLIDALKFDKIFTTVQVGEYYAHPLGSKKARRVWTTNWLLTNWVPNEFKAENIAGKTGYIESSGYNFAVSLSDERAHSIAVVVLGASGNEQRFSEARDLAEWTFAHFVWPDEEGYSALVE